jgi:hypothetical protein
LKTIFTFAVLILGLTPDLDKGQSNVHNAILVDGSKFTTLAEALAAVNNPGTILISSSAGIVPVTMNATVPPGITLAVENGAKLAIATGVRLTIQGPFQAGYYQVFTYTGSGIVAFGTGAPIAQTVYPNWFPGDDVGAQVNNAYAALPLVTESSFGNGAQPTGIISLAGYSGEVRLSTTISLASRRVSLIGPGSNNLTLLCQIDGDCIRIYDNHFGNLYNGMAVKGFQLAAGAGAGAESVAIHSGGIWQLHLSDLVVRDFKGTSAIGIWFDNGRFTSSSFAFTEEGIFEDITLMNNRTGWRFSAEGSAGDASYGYNNWRRILFLTDTGQIGVVVDGEPTGTRGPVVYHSTINWVFEPYNASTTTTTAINLADFAFVDDNHYEIYQEPTYSHVVFQFLLGNSAMFTGDGELQFHSSHDASPLIFKLGTNAIFNVTGSVVFNNTPWCILSPGTQGGTAVLSPLTGGWGSTAKSGACSGNWNALWMRLSAAGTGQGTNPTIAINFNQTAHTSNPQSTWRNPPVCSLEMVGASTPPENMPLITQGDPPAITTTRAQFQVRFTPVANASYDFLMRCTPK